MIQMVMNFWQVIILQFNRKEWNMNGGVFRIRFWNSGRLIIIMIQPEKKRAEKHFDLLFIVYHSIS